MRKTPDPDFWFYTYTYPHEHIHHPNKRQEFLLISPLSCCTTSRQLLMNLEDALLRVSPCWLFV